MGVDGARIIREALKSNGLSQNALAHKLGAGQQTVNQWATGKRKPSGAWRKLLEIVLGIPEHVWLTDDEAQSLARLQSSK